MDTIIKGTCQILTPIPVFLIQVVIAGSLDKRDVTIYTMAFIVLALGWMWPTLVITVPGPDDEGKAVRLRGEAFRAQ